VRIDDSKQIKSGYNIAPSQMIGAIRINQGEKEFTNVKWGLISSWSKNDSFANEVLEPVHDRMPLIFKENNESTDKVSELLKPFDANKMISHTGSKAVNTPANNSPKLILNSK
jgi:putative SOS response-associated peptidase YedK